MSEKPTYEELEQRIQELQQAEFKRERADGALKESEERFRLAFHTSPDSINLNRASDGMYIDINEGFTDIMGYTREDVIGKTSLSLNIWKNPEDRERLVDGLTKTGYVDNLEAQFIGKDGKIRVGLMSARILRINGENVILSITRDITDRKRAEEALQESEKRFRDLAEMLPEVLFETDRNLNLTYANRRAFELTGYSPQDLKGLNGLELLAPEERDRAKANLSMRVKGENPGPIEYLALKKDGSTFPILFHANSIMKEGELSGLRGIIIDITERKRAEEEKARPSRSTCRYPRKLSLK